jgi:hypothetical protein
VVEPAPQPALISAVNVSPSDSQGILAPVAVTVSLTDLQGDPLLDREVRFRAIDGTVGEWWPCNECGPYDLGPEAIRITNPAGEVRVEWVLGPDVGEQTLAVWAEGTDTLEVRKDALPGVVLVGLWDLSWDEDRLETLPSDTMRVHATNLTGPFVGETLAEFPEGSPKVILGQIQRGPGFDDAWPFQFSPAHARAIERPWAHVRFCAYDPPVSPGEVEEILGDYVLVNFCGGPLRLVAIEEVPAGYLEELAGS